MLSKTAIKEFQYIYEKEYGKRLSASEAEKQANNLLRLYKVVYSSLPNTQKHKNPLDNSSSFTNNEI